MKNFEPRMNANGHEFFSLLAPQALKISHRRGAEIAEIFVLPLRTLRLCGKTFFEMPAALKKYSRSFAFICGLFFIATTTLPASAQEGPSPQAVLMVANVAGECEILNSMVSFQKKNNMPGGNDYVSQFWASQAATLGITVEQMADRCNSSTTAYNKLWDAAAPKGGGGGNE